MFGFPRLKPPWGGDADAEMKALESASAAELQIDYFLPELGATEQNPHLHMLWSHCRRNQIPGESMRRMRRDDLEYLAAHSGEAYFMTQEGELLRGHVEKLRANADRARYELERRDRLVATTLTTALAAAVGGGVGGAIVLLFQ